MWNLELKLKTKPELKLEKAIDIPNAIERTFNYNQDRLIITINDIHLYLPLPYVFSDLLGDFLLIISDLLSLESGKGTYGFSQNDIFDADWILTWDKEKVIINIDSRVFQGHAHEMPSETLFVNKTEFLISWKNLFISLSKFIDFKQISLDYNDENLIINRLLNTNFYKNRQG